MMDACYVDEEQATAQPGDFYGGWVTKNIVGGQKGFKGTTALTNLFDTSLELN